MSSEEITNFKVGLPKSRIPKLRRCASLHGKREFLQPRLRLGESDLNSVDAISPLNNQFNRPRTQTTPDVGIRKLSLPIRGSVPQSPTCSEDDNDTLSVCSTMSCGPPVPRRHSCVLHCAREHEDAQSYLTPTQRFQKEIRHLKHLLREARQEINNKDLEIERLTKELVELKFTVGDRETPEDSTDSKLTKSPSPNTSPQQDYLKTFEERLKSETKHKNTMNEKYKSETDISLIGKESTKKTRKPSKPLNGSARSPQSLIDIPRSLTDSGHFDASSSMGSKESLHLRRIESEFCEKCAKLEKKLQDLYDKKIEETKRNGSIQVQELKERHNDRVENLLQKLDDANSRDVNGRRLYEEEMERTKELELKIERMEQEQAEQEIKHHQMYLHMYRKGQDAARFESESESRSVSVTDLVEQLQVTEHELERIKALVPQASFLSTDEAFLLWIDALRKNHTSGSGEAARSPDGMSEAEVTLQFLKSAIYYFLTDKDNHKGHLRAIQSILGFSELEKINIEKSVKSNKRF